MNLILCKNYFSIKRIPQQETYHKCPIGGIHSESLSLEKSDSRIIFKTTNKFGC